MIRPIPAGGQITDAVRDARALLAGPDDPAERLHLRLAAVPMQLEQVRPVGGQAASNPTLQPVANAATDQLYRILSSAHRTLRGLGDQATPAEHTLVRNLNADYMAAAHDVWTSGTRYPEWEPVQFAPVFLEPKLPDVTPEAP